MSELIFSVFYLATVALQTVWLTKLSNQVNQLRADLERVRRHH